ncbi:MAG: PaaI family thioesterase [Deltaproteobacteria bacterium]|nr:PaaI family thioesterase [Deltaproteobacteria bacterium]
MELVKDKRCFVCGEENRDGLKLRVLRDGDKGVKAEFVAHDRYRGWSTYLHGGVVSLIFDELLGWNSFYLGYDAMTARMEVRYRKPIPLGSRVIFKGTLEKETKGLLEIKTVAYLEDGSLAAEGRGKMVIINQKGV